MRILVLAALAVVVYADVSELTGYQYNPPASSYGVPQNSYGVPQNSVTERFFNAVPTAPSPSLNLPAFEHQDFNAFNPLPGVVISTTAAPFIDTSFSSTTPAPIDTSLLVSSTPAPSLLSGFDYTTPVPSLGLNYSFVSSTPTPNVIVTSGSQENLNLNAGFPSLGFSAGLSGYSTPAPSLFTTTVAPTISSSGFGLGSFGFPTFNSGLGFSGFSTPAPITYQNGGLGVEPISPGILPQPQQVSKHLYFYSAPEEPEAPRPRINIAPVAPPKKNVRIIFIKAPTPPAPAPISIVAPPQDEEKTVVYVLVKKPEENQQVEIQTPPPTAPPKPEVYFIKYKNPQEAEQAIAEVQGAASTSGGPSFPAETATGASLLTSINRESLSTSLPVINYVSSTPAPPLPIFNYVTSTTPSPLYVGGISGPLLTGIGNIDISPNLISSGADTSSLFSTGAPLITSTGDSGLFLGSTTTTTAAPPVAPHVTYGPPSFRKKRSLKSAVNES